MKAIKKFLQVIYTIYAFILFSLFALAAFILVLFIIPFGKNAVASFIFLCGYITAVAWYFLIGLKPGVVYESPHDKSKPYVFVSNHTSYMDIPALLRYIRQPVRVMGKVEISKIPIFGFLYRSVVILVDRSSTAKRGQSLAEAKQTVSKNISVVVFPEGTFNETDQPLKDFYDGAFRMAIETCTPIKPILFLDSADRLHWSSIFSLTPGPLRAVYLQEIPIDGFEDVAGVAALRKKTYDIMDAALRRYKYYPLKEVVV